MSHLLANRLLAAGGVVLDVRTLTDGQLLRRTGDTIDSVAASTGGITTIASGSLPAAATLSITDIAATYSYLVIKMTGASSDTAARQPLIRVSTDNGSSYDSTAGNYEYTVIDRDLDTLGAGSLASLISGATQAAAATCTVSGYLFGYQGGPNMRFTCDIRNSAGIDFQTEGFYIGSVSAINAIQLLWNGTGSFDAGTYALYGIS